MPSSPQSTSHRAPTAAPTRLREALGVRRLAREVELLRDHVGELFDERRQAVLAKLRGVTVEEARVSSSTQAMLANVTGPGGVRIELSELTPESLQRKAMEGWR